MLKLLPVPHSMPDIVEGYITPEGGDGYVVRDRGDGCVHLIFYVARRFQGAVEYHESRRLLLPKLGYDNSLICAWSAFGSHGRAYN